MKAFIFITFLVTLLFSESAAQIFSIGAGINYKGSFEEKTNSTRDVNGFLMFSGGIYLHSLLMIPVKTGIDFGYGSKTVLDYHSSNQPPGAGSIDVNRSIKLIIIEIPLLYRIYQNNLVSVLLGSRIGLNHATLDEHFSGSDYSYSSTSAVFGISSEIEMVLPLSFSVSGAVNYRFLKNKIISDVREYDFSGLWIDVKILYNF